MKRNQNIMKAKIKKIRQGYTERIIVLFDDNRILRISPLDIDAEYLKFDGEKEIDQIIKEYALANYSDSEIILDHKRISDIEVDGVYSYDYPNFCDAYASFATYKEDDGSFRECTEEELDWITENMGDEINELALENYF